MASLADHEIDEGLGMRSLLSQRWYGVENVGSSQELKVFAPVPRVNSCEQPAMGKYRARQNPVLAFFIKSLVEGN
jgi:hypothetical protein